MWCLCLSMRIFENLVSPWAAHSSEKLGQAWINLRLADLTILDDVKLLLERDDKNEY